MLTSVMLLVGCPRKADPKADAMTTEEELKAKTDEIARLNGMPTTSAPTTPGVPGDFAPDPPVNAAYKAAMDAWSVKTRKACKMKPDAIIFPKTKRAMLEDCNTRLAAGLPDSKFPPLPPDTERTGLSSADGCRYYVDSYVDTQGVRARFRCKYDPTMLGGAEWEMLK